jgi:hypothetical protein
MRTFAQKQSQAPGERLSRPTPQSGTCRPSREAYPTLNVLRTLGTQAVSRSPRGNSETVDSCPDLPPRTGFGHDFSRIPVGEQSAARIQPKLTVGPSRDIHEQEADRVADWVMSEDAGSFPPIAAANGAARLQRFPPPTQEQIELAHQGERLPAEFHVLVEKAASYGLPVKFLRLVEQGVTMTSTGEGGGAQYDPLANILTLSEPEVSAAQSLDPTAASIASGTIPINLYHESTHAWFDLMSGDADVARFVAEQVEYYTGAPVKAGGVTNEPYRMFMEAAATYVEHRVQNWWMAYRWLSFVAQEGLLDEAMVAKARRDYDKAMASDVFGYSYTLQLALPPTREQTETTRPVSAEFKRFMDERILEGKIPDRFEDVTLFAEMIASVAPKPPGQEPAGTLQRSETSEDSNPWTAPPAVDTVLATAGAPLAEATQRHMEGCFGHSFSAVRIHSDTRAAEAARSVGARAFTVGNRVVFGANQYAPETRAGQRLLAHELTHVVQQDGGHTLHRKPAGQRNISRGPIQLMLRKDPLSDAAKQEEVRKKAAIQRHVEQQRKVAGFLDNARKIQPDPKKGYRDPDTLFHNTVGLLDGGKLTLTVLSPTHVSPNLHFDSRVKFDSNSKQSPIGGDYPAVPRAGLEGVVFDDTNAFGKVNLPSPPPSPPNIHTLPPKEEHAPGESVRPPEKAKPVPAPAPPPAPAPFVPGDIFYFTRGLDITEAQLKNTFVHEGQHIADMSPKVPIATGANDVLEAYKSEFRAFWIQPPLPGVGGLAQESIDRLPEPKGKADNSRKLTISKPQDCKICTPPNVSAPAEVKTKLKNPRQEAIFWYIMTNYSAQQYDCCYVYNKNFYDEVNRFAFPESVNLINSDRLMNLNLELPNLNKSMKLPEVNSTKFVVLLTRLDTLDWIFLNDPKLSKPFWDALKIAAPGFLYRGVNALAKKGTKNPVSAADVDKALSGK